MKDKELRNILLSNKIIDDEDVAMRFYPERANRFIDIFTDVNTLKRDVKLLENRIETNNIKSRMQKIEERIDEWGYDFTEVDKIKFVSEKLECLLDHLNLEMKCQEVEELSTVQKNIMVEK